MQIANPIYDVVFKYLMNDEKLARLLLSAIIGEEVVSLKLRPTEHQFPVGKALMVMRMDFSARIRYANGEEQLVILELQKAKLATDIMRFRRYLGEQYRNKNNVVQEPAEEYAQRKALPILSIYFLGHKLDHITAPVIRINRSYTDAATGEVLQEREIFIESLTHDSIIIQIPYLTGHRRNELEQLLSLFDQSFINEDRHLLNIEESEVPKRYRALLRRLQQAVAEPEVREIMDAEDDLIEEFEDYQRMIAEKERELFEKEQRLSQKDQELSQKDQELSQKDQELSQKDQELSHKDQELSHKDKELSQKDQALSQKDQELQKKHEQLRRVAVTLTKAGQSPKEVAAILGIELEELNDLLS